MSDWPEYRNLVLSELKRISDDQKAILARFDSFKQGYANEMIEVGKSMASLKTSVKFGASVYAAIVSGVVSFMVWYSTKK